MNRQKSLVIGSSNDENALRVSSRKQTAQHILIPQANSTTAADSSNFKNSLHVGGSVKPSSYKA